MIDGIDENKCSTPNKNVNKNIVDTLGSPINEHFWYSKPIFMNIITQQIFLKLSTENNGMM